MELKEVYSLTYNLDKKMDGLFVIKKHLIDESTYNLIKDEKRIFTGNHDGEMNYGTTKNGIVIATLVSSYNMIGEVSEAMFNIILDLINIGLDNEDGSIVIPRSDLQKSLDNSSMILIGIPRVPKLLNKYFSENEIIKIKDEKDIHNKRLLLMNDSINTYINC